MFQKKERADYFQRNREKDLVLRKKDLILNF